MTWTFPPLTDGRVRLEPLTDDHREPLRAAADDERIWTWNVSSGFGPHFDGWFAAATSETAAGTRAAFAVRTVADGRLVGSSSYLALAPAHKRLDIGHTWYVPAVWGTVVNPACKRLLLGYAFEVLGVNRAALQTDLRNTRSQAAIAKLGAVREGVLRKHMITHTGHVRDTVAFGITADDWPTVKARLDARLAV